MNRDEFFHKLPKRDPHELELIQIAYWLSKSVHRNQARDGGERYFEHPRRVALGLIERGFSDTRTIIVALLHDTIEDTNTPLKVIVSLFGMEIWDNLKVVSKEIPSFDPITGEILGRTKKLPVEYFAGIAAAPLHVRVVKLDDRRDNMSDMKGFDEARKRKSILETRRFILPIAESTSPRYAAELENLCIAAEQSLESP